MGTEARGLRQRLFQAIQRWQIRKSRNERDSSDMWDYHPLDGDQARDRDRMNRPSPDVSRLTVVLDRQAYPHIVDRIVDFLPFNDILQWRLTCRAMYKRLDLDSLVMTVLPFSGSDDECIVHVRTRGGFSLGVQSCREYINLVELEGSQNSDYPIFWKVGEMSINDLHIRGGCPHEPLPESRDIAAGLDQWVLDIISGPGLRYALDQWVLDIISRPGLRYTWLRELCPVRHQFTVHIWPQSGRTTSTTTILGYWCRYCVYHDNWLVNPASRVTPTRVGFADDWPISIFTVHGQERSTRLFITPPSAVIIYDFSHWSPPTWREPTQPTRSTEAAPTTLSRLEHLVNHALDYKHPVRIYIVGWEKVDPYWLDPQYPGDLNVPCTDYLPFPTHICCAIRDGARKRGIIQSMGIYPVPNATWETLTGRRCASGKKAEFLSSKLKWPEYQVRSDY